MTIIIIPRSICSVRDAVEFYQRKNRRSTGVITRPIATNAQRLLIKKTRNLSNVFTKIGNLSLVPNVAKNFALAPKARKLCVGDVTLRSEEKMIESVKAFTQRIRKTLNYKWCY